MHGGNIHLIKRDIKLSNNHFVDFSANINPLGVPSELMGFFKSSLEDVVHYPDPEYYDLYRETAIFFKCQPENLFLGNGAADVIYQWLQKVSPRKALLPAPTFSEYEKALRRMKTQITYAPLFEENHFDISAEKLASHIEKDTDLVVLCNPNNPTGRIIPLGEMEEILRLTQRHGCHLMVDEAFMDFVEQGQQHTLIGKIDTLPNVSILRSFTKLLAVPGIRLGAVVSGNTRLIKACKEEAVPWQINTIANALHQYINTDNAREYIVNSRSLVAKEKNWLYAGLSAINQFRVVEGAANYLLVHWTDHHRRAMELREGLLLSGIIVRDCSNYVGLDEHWFRVAIKQRKENEGLLQAIVDFLKK